MSMHLHAGTAGRTRVRSELRRDVPRLLAGAVVVYLLLAGTGLLLIHVLSDSTFGRGDRAVSRWFYHHRTGTLDVRYLSTLSSDAAPTLDRLTGPMRTCALSDIARDLRDDPDDWRAYNVARTTAAPIVADLDEPGESCYRGF